MGEDSWLEQLLAGARQQTSNWRYSQKTKKICQWVENATLPQGCAGIVLREGTIYCPYHTQMWELIMMESKRKPEVDD